MLLFFAAATGSHAAWEGPVSLITGSWGDAETNFGIENDDTSDRFPSLAGVLLDGRIVISDQVNEREALYNSDGQFLKLVNWFVDLNGTITPNPEYAQNQYWNIQGYTAEGNMWMKIDNYLLKSPSGQLLTTKTDRPAELGKVIENSLSSGQYKVTVKYPDSVWSYIGKGRMSNYIRDKSGNLYGYGQRQAIRLDTCGKELARLTMPIDDIQEESRGEEVEPFITVIAEFGSPIIDPNGNVYSWKRTPAEYSVLKWTWVDDPNVPTGPDAPSSLSIAASFNGLYLTWAASPQDPGCVTGYEVARATSAGGVAETIMTLPAGTLMYNDTTANAGITYYYKIRAAAGSEYSPYTSEVSGKR